MFFIQHSSEQDNGRMKVFTLVEFVMETSNGFFQALKALEIQIEVIKKFKWSKDYVRQFKLEQ